MWELKAAAKTVAEYICGIQPGESVLIYADSDVEPEVAKAVGEASFLAGGEPCLMWYARRPQPDLEPPKPLAAAMLESDVLIELSWKYLIHTEALLRAQQNGARYACLTMMTRGIMERCIGNAQHYAKIVELGERLTGMLDEAREMRITSPAGTDLVCNIEGSLIDHASRPARKPGQQTYPAGQVSWYPHAESIRGTLVFDGAMWPPEDLGLLQQAVSLTVRDGVVTAISGKEEADRVRRWFESFGNPHTYELAHISYGVNPGARLSGNILEDERILGGVEVGIGAQPPQLGIFEVPLDEATRGHTDGVMLRPTVFLDGTAIEQDGVFSHPDLVEIIESF